MRKARHVRRTDDDRETGTEPRAVAEGRGRFNLSVQSARAIAEASVKSGFPVPAHAQAVIDAEDGAAPQPAPASPAAETSEA
ncbi:MAG: hypothetical protein ACK4YQ_16945 [Phenylobacterium sp.]|uniref:hypothetical protein n=1 Tax=Phenylobacterium sp. TaxID=1871053 RepID=UPI00391CE5BF